MLRIQKAGVSIHAPAIRRDSAGPLMMRVVAAFQSTRLRLGATRRLGTCRSSPATFQSTRLRLGATALFALVFFFDARVSIHAPAIRRDVMATT